MKTKKAKISFMIYLFVSLMILFSLSGLILSQGLDKTENSVGRISSDSGSGFIGVALATGLASLGAGIGVGIVGAAAIGALSENPKMLGRTLIFVGLAEGVAIYGLVISIIILGRM